MRNSGWFEHYEKERKQERAKKVKSNNLVFIILPIMILAGLISAISGGALNTAEGRQGVMMFGGVAAFILIFSAIIVVIGKKKDITKAERENVKQLLHTDEEVDLFDQQMSTTPIAEFSAGKGVAICATQDFVYKRRGEERCSFIWRRDIANLYYCKTASTGINPLKAAYFYDLRRADNKVIFNGLVNSGKELAKLEEFFHTLQPSIGFYKA